MSKEEIVKIFREIAEKVESGYIGAYSNTTYSSMPFTTVVDYMEFTNRSELEFTYKPGELAELTPTTMIHSSDVTHIALAKYEVEDMFGKYKITIKTNSDLYFMITVELKDGEKFEVLKEEDN